MLMLNLVSAILRFLRTDISTCIRNRSSKKSAPTPLNPSTPMSCDIEYYNAGLMAPGGSSFYGLQTCSNPPLPHELSYIRDHEILPLELLYVRDHAILCNPFQAARSNRSAVGVYTKMYQSPNPSTTLIFSER